MEALFFGDGHLRYYLDLILSVGICIICRLLCLLFCVTDDRIFKTLPNFDIQFENKNHHLKKFLKKTPQLSGFIVPFRVFSDGNHSVVFLGKSLYEITFQCL